VIDKECRVILWNRSNEVYTGRSKESVLGKRIDLGFLFKGKTPPSLAELILQMSDEEIISKYGHKGVAGSSISPGAFESVRSIWINGDERIMTIQAARIYNPQGEVIGAIQTAQDITDRIRAEAERKRLQDQLSQAQKLEAIGTLAGGIAHDFNNMLAAIIGYTELSIDEPEEKIRRLKLNEVLKASKRAKNLVRQILTFSRHTEQEKKPLDMKFITKEALKLLRSTLPATVEIRQNITNDPCMINADLTQMHQIIMNLCTNAAQAMGEKGGILDVKLTMSDIQDSILRQHPDAVAGLYVKLTVKDTGFGIDPSIKDRIFEPFFTTKGIGEGTGLGLSVVYGIVKNHQGIITVESEPGSGATFDVYIPTITKMDARESIPPPEDTKTGNERILLVDDDQALLDMGKMMLESLGYIVDTRTSGMEAMGSFLAAPGFYDLIITDMTMPLMTGSELATEILRIRPNMPIILCTGFSEYIDENRAKDIGIRAFVMKPFSKTTLSKIIREVLDT
jgi:signal transduction histidine kinase/CheY-like chemotaxis protein